MTGELPTLLLVLSACDNESKQPEREVRSETRDKLREARVCASACVLKIIAWKRNMLGIEWKFEGQIAKFWGKANAEEKEMGFPSHHCPS